MHNKIKIATLILSLTGISFMSCKKYLDGKPDKKLVVPSTLRDLQAILDNNNQINRFKNNGVGEASADNYYLNDNDFNSLYFLSDKSVYIWDKEIFYDNPPGNNEWSDLYSIVYKANVVLSSINGIRETDQNASEWKNVKGSACFFRGYAFSILARNYAKAFDKNTGSTDLGIPLRLGTDFNEKSIRASVAQTYDQIIKDLKESVSLLPAIPQHVMRPSKRAAYALLSRVYLFMRDYEDAGSYADSALAINKTLMDYNDDPSIIANSTVPFMKFNSEVIFHAEGILNPLYNSWANIDSLLYASYDSNDLRKTLFFNDHLNGTFGFKGNYTADVTIFDGIATDEVYLTRAECYARTGNKDAALEYLNSLLIKRWKAGTFIPVIASDAVDALDKILIERRKQLLMRDLRWMDIKRLNKEGANISLRRTVNGITYSLQPNDNKFALPLPETIIRISGMTQNPR
jgi:tetratricopeptide (TPR) repeat protein